MEWKVNKSIFWFFFIEECREVGLWESWKAALGDCDTPEEEGWGGGGEGRGGRGGRRGGEDGGGEEKKEKDEEE